MNCPKCKEQLIESITFKNKFFLFKYKVYSILCPCCEYEKIKEIRISKEDFINSLEVNKLRATNTKIESTDKTYKQSYENVVNPFVIAENKNKDLEVYN